MARFFKSILFALVIFYFAGCKEGEYNKDSILNNQRPEKKEVYEIEDGHTNIGRAIWQKPGLVIEKLGDISDKVIADIGAGTGYFSFKLALKAKKVIAVEIEKKYLDFIDSTKAELPVEKQSSIETRLAVPDNPNLKENEADIILIINTVAYIQNLPQYLEILKKGLKKGGRLMIIDYKMKRLPINAPPKTERIYLDKLEDLLIESGYTIEQSDDTSLDYQYIIQAIKN